MDLEKEMQEIKESLARMEKQIFEIRYPKIKKSDMILRRIKRGLNG